jgi:hypothetical protein
LAKFDLLAMPLRAGKLHVPTLWPVGIFNAQESRRIGARRDLHNVIRLHL